MGAKFGNAYPVLVARQNDRERLALVAVAGLTFSLIIVFSVVTQMETPVAQAADFSNFSESLSAPPLSTITVFTPERSIQPGTPMSDVRLKEAYWPRSHAPEGAILDLAEARGMTTKVALIPGIPILREHITKNYSEGQLYPSKGNRAVTIAVDEVTSIESHASPGSYVDVSLTYYHKRELTSKIIVQNGRVLSLGGKTDRKAGRGSMNTRTITLDLSPKDALEIQTAKKLGTLSLMMRHPEDHSPVKIDTWGEGKISGSTEVKKARRCIKGSARVGGNNFVVKCDGGLIRDFNQIEP
jgi:Flp pilus assembly protein CpaB